MAAEEGMHAALRLPPPARRPGGVALQPHALGLEAVGRRSAGTRCSAPRRRDGERQAARMP